MEIYAATRTQEGKKSTEDAFHVDRGEPTFAALCDGSGNAQGVAKRALGIFQKLTQETPLDRIQEFRTWSNWAKLLDSALMGGPQSTFLAIGITGQKIVGCCVGDSRLYRIGLDGTILIISEAASKARLGSGKTDPFPIHLPFNRGEILLLMTDGAWTPLSLSTLGRIWVSSSSRHFSEFPTALLEEAGKHGLADDMTSVALRA